MKIKKADDNYNKVDFKIKEIDQFTNIFQISTQDGEHITSINVVFLNEEDGHETMLFSYNGDLCEYIVDLVKKDGPDTRLELLLGKETTGYNDETTMSMYEIQDIIQRW